MATPTFSWTDHAYIPILFTRRGERSATRESTPGVKDRLVPIWVVAPVPWDSETEGPARSVEDHINGLADDLVKDWGTDPAYLDTLYLDDAPLSTGQHPLVAIVNQARALNLPLIPVTGPDRSTTHHQAAADVVALGDGQGLCLRIGRDDALEWQKTPTARAWDLDALLMTLVIDPEEVDIVIDFGDDVDSPTATAALMRAIMAVLPHQMRWRSVTFAGTSIPSSLQGVPTMQISPFARGEWDTYVQLLTGAPLGRAVRFGDYGVQHPDVPTDVDPRFLRVFSTFRYSTPQGWLIARGLELRVAGYTHVHDLAALLVARPEYAGAGFSVGDKWLEDCANHACNNGNAERWRRVSTNHHLARVTTDLAAGFGLTAP